MSEIPQVSRFLYFKIIFHGLIQNVIKTNVHLLQFKVELLGWLRVREKEIEIRKKKPNISMVIKK